MTRALAALACLAFGSFALACAQPDLPPPGQVAAIPSCPDSEESGCESGMPLCAMDERDQGGACLMCRCTALPALSPDTMGIGHLAGVPMNDYSR